MVVLLNRRFARGLPRPRPCRGVLLGGRPDLAAVWLRGHAFTNAEGLVTACCYPWDHVMLPMGPLVKEVSGGIDGSYFLRESIPSESIP